MCRGKGALPVKVSRCGQPSVVRAVIEVGQRKQKPRCRIGSNSSCISVDDRLQKQGVRMCRFKLPGIEWCGKIVREQAFANADRAVEIIVVEEVAAAARCQRRPIAKRRQRVGKAAVEAADASLEEKICV